MNAAAIKKIRRMWGVGLAMFALRLYQNTYDFDPHTGLHFLSVAGAALLGAVILSGAAAFFFSRKERAQRPLFAEHFAAPVNSTIVLVSAGMLLATGGISSAVNALSAGSVAPLVTAVLAVITFLGILVLIRQMRRGEAESVVPVLPSLFFGAFWVLTLYIPAGNDPIIERYYLPILAAAASAYAFAQLAGFFRRETSVRAFSFIAEWAVELCIATIAELDCYTPMFAGCALFFSVFLTLQEGRVEKTQTVQEEE